MPKKDDTNKIIIFSTPDEKISLDVLLEDETVWLTQDKSTGKIIST